MLTLDVTSDESVEAAVREVVRRAGRIDMLVNNAGFGVSPAGAEESSIEQARSIFDTNFFGIVRMTRTVVPQMRRQGAGRIINIGSALGFLPMPYGALYAATKRVKEVMATADEPRVVAEVVLKAASAAHPKLRYPAGGLAGRLRFLRTFLPAGLMDAGIRRDLRLDAPTVASGGVKP
jgi:hypothetical protein